MFGVVDEGAGDLGCTNRRRRLLILNGEVFDSGKKCFASGPSLSGAGVFEVYLWTEETLLGKLGFSGGEDGLIGGTEAAVDVDVGDSMTTENTVVRGLKERFAS